MPIDYSKYHPEWKTRIRPDILKRARYKCEGSPLYPDCRAGNHLPHPETGSKVVLTIAHMDQDINNNRYENLRAWCQRCHLAHDRNFREKKKIADQFLTSEIPLKDRLMMLKNISNFFIYHAKNIREMDGHPELWSFIASWFAENTIIQEANFSELERTLKKE